jgi:GAF domain-containing protein
MNSQIINFFRSEEDNEASFIVLTRNILFFVLAVNLALLPLVSGLIGENSRNPRAFATLTVTLILEGISLYAVLRGRVLMAKIVVPLALTVAVTIISLTTNGLKNTSMVGLPVILVISAILLGRRAFFVVTPIAIAAVLIVARADLSRSIEFVPAGMDDALIISVLLVGCGGIIQLLITRLNENIRRAQESELSYIRENRELTELRSTLEARVNNRTMELERANNNNERRARQFETVAQVARVISNIQDLETLLPRIVHVISEQFGHYHTGIFLLDEAGQYALLRAANSEGGRRMLDREHKLLVGQTGIVGYVTATGQPRIALDVGQDAVFFDNPDLPDTHSEIALPLRIGGQIIGALDVQSTEQDAFKQDDIAALSTLADQVSIAIQNTRALEDARRALAEAQTSYGETVREAWRVMRPPSLTKGIQLIDSSLKPLEQAMDEDFLKKAVEHGKTTVSTERTGTLAVPIRMRGQVIGVMSLNNNGLHKWSEDDVDIAEAVAERLSLAIETASLLRTAQHRADIEKVTTDISTKIGSSSRFETILQTAAQELSKALGGSEVLVQIEPVALKLGMAE